MDAVGAFEPGAQCVELMPGVVPFVEVRGVDLGGLKGPQLQAAVALVYSKGVVCFRGQEALTPAAELNFAKSFPHDPNEPQGASYAGGAAAQPKLPAPFGAIAVIGAYDLSDYHGLTATSTAVYPPWARDDQLLWHTDGAADTKPPPDLTTMRCVETPETGGETHFRCARRAAAALYDAESATYKIRLSDGSEIDASLLRVRYRLLSGALPRPLGFSLESCDSAKTREGDSLVNDAAGTEWPLLIREPISGDVSLCTTYHVSSAVLLDASGGISRLFDFDEANDAVERAWAPESNDVAYVHKWLVGDVVAWTNRLVIHTATNSSSYAGKTRIHHRIRIRAPPGNAPMAMNEAPHQLFKASEARASPSRPS
ncbi:hypothetical protein M885DRAFT_514519 [Pelagophyceae sp. CCMP2097]|nr:hypothetical protein M885DRAFT_514519 [Pelagophyceae sp. CCMP2097]